MHSVVMKTGVLPMYDEDGNEIYAILVTWEKDRIIQDFVAV